MCPSHWPVATICSPDLFSWPRCCTAEWPTAGASDPVSGAPPVPKFHSATLKTTGVDGKCINSWGVEAARLALFPGRSRWAKPICRTIEGPVKEATAVVSDREERRSTHAHMHTHTVFGWQFWQMKTKQKRWAFVLTCICLPLKVCVWMCVLLEWAYVWFHFDMVCLRVPERVCAFLSQQAMDWDQCCPLAWHCYWAIFVLAFSVTHTHTSHVISHSLSLVQMACGSFLFYSILVVPQYWDSGLAGAICPNYTDLTHNPLSVCLSVDIHVCLPDIFSNCVSISSLPLL